MMVRAHDENRCTSEKFSLNILQEKYRSYEKNNNNTQCKSPVRRGNEKAIFF